jgi:hypothetical protein
MDNLGRFEDELAHAGHHAPRTYARRGHGTEPQAMEPLETGGPFA